MGRWASHFRPRPGWADIMCQIWAKMGRWALMGRQNTGPGWAEMGRAAAQSTATPVTHCTTDCRLKEQIQWYVISISLDFAEFCWSLYIDQHNFKCILSFSYDVFRLRVHFSCRSGSCILCFNMICLFLFIKSTVLVPFGSHKLLKSLRYWFKEKSAHFWLLFSI